ncbi:ABC transporter substrate-binding protein [Allonocardiopsis opalescens]|uniref:Multiple sugar transport system substrate-binding protein n=1 Tax=Allonocardiopsis opalescens TaxID=1144618 RepID=A0A2T0PX64_9ACTN|nr:sugar ABC transporter substrate-binding protein [Allonocardiopsis opalescens]PRX96133.1 multiple sugar transport system substrate-binding protein [Allonocardiopsis opalescens]
MVGTRGRGRRVAAAAAVLALVAAGCGGGADDGTVELRYAWWGNADRAELTQQAIDLFEEQHPNISVTPTFQEWDAYWQRLNTDAAGGGLPDVMHMDYMYLREYADRGLLLDLNEQVGENLDVSGTLDAFADVGTVDGARYAVPIGGNTFTMVYIPEEFEAAGVEVPEDGWTWDDYDAAIEQVSESSGEIYGGHDYGTLIWVLELQLRQEGGELFTEDGGLGVDAARLAEFWSHMQPLRDSGAIVPTSEAVEVQPLATIGAGLSASEFNWDNQLARFTGETDRELALAPVPTSDPDNLGQYLKPSMMYAAFSRTEHPAEAAMLIDFMTNSPEVAQIFGGSRGIPANTAQREGAEYNEVDQAILDYEDAIFDQLTVPPPAPPAGAGSLEGEFIRLGETVGLGEATPEEAAQEFIAYAEQTLGS